MGKLEDDYPELRELSPKVEYFELGKEPPAWKVWADSTPAERLRAGEMLRRIAYGYDEPVTRIPPVHRCIDRRGS